VQTTLLGLAIAIILALVSALVAPLVVDWNNYRTAFEQKASLLAGLPVHINGPIEARILPSPRIKMHDVDVGQAGAPPQVRAGVVEVEFGLGGLIRGQLNATELHIVAPQVSIGLDRSGTIDWPALALSFRSDALAISRLDIEDGRVVLADAASGSRLLLQKFWFNGEVRSFVGPIRGEGAFVVGDELYGYRISAGRLDDLGGMKLKLGVDPSNHPLTAEFDGTFTFDKGSPQFDGTLALSRPVGAALARGDRVMSDPWQLTGKIRATPASASLQELAVQYGPDERAVNFTGKGEITFGARPHFDGSVAARQIDVDRMLADPDVTHRPPLVMIKNFVTAVVAAVKPPLPATLNVAVDALMVGGTTLQSLRGGVRFDGKGWSLNDVAFRAPGLSEIGLSGRVDAGPQGLAFSGPAKLETVDLKMLMGWLEGRSEPPSGPGESFVARGDIAIASDRFTLDRLSAALYRENVEGRLAYTWAAGNKPAAVDGELHSATLNVDALSNFVKNALSDSALEVPRQVALILDVGKATFAGVDAQRVNAKVKFDAGILHIDKLSIGDLGGAALDLGGRIDELSSQPRGRLTLDLDARTLSGLINITSRVAPRVADALRPFADHLAPAKVHGVLTVDRAAAGRSAAKLDLNGDLGTMRLAFNGQATGEPAQPAAAQLRVTGRLDADDGGALVQLFDLDRVLAVDQLPGQLTFSANGPLDGTVQVKGVAAAGGFSTVTEGTVHFNAGQSPSGSLQVKASASDLRPLHQTMTGQAGEAVPVSVGAIIGFAGSDLSITDLAVGAGKSSLHGRFDLKLASPIDISGDIAADDVDAAAVSAMLLGLPTAAAGTRATWSREPIGSGAFAPVKGTVTFKFDRAALTTALTARDLKGVVKLQPSEIVFDGVEGSLAGGRLAAELAVRHDPEDIAVRGRIELAGASVAALLPSAKSAVDGTVALKLQGEGLGASPDGLIASLHGGGSVTLGDAHFAGIDPAAFDAAIRVADPNGPIDEPKLRTAVNTVMENGRLNVPQGDGDLTMAGGQIRLVAATMKTADGADLSVDGMLDLNTLAADVHMRLSGPAAANALIPARPELAINAKGPFPTLERTIDVSKLMAWLTLRATELQTRRLELIEASRRQQALGPAVRPASPAVRFITMGTAVETADHAELSAGQTIGARSLDRLRPVLAAPGPATRSDAGTAAAAASPSSIEVKPAMPQPALHSPLDLLFRSQN